VRQRRSGSAYRCRGQGRVQLGRPRHERFLVGPAAEAGNLLVLLFLASVYERDDRGPRRARRDARRPLMQRKDFLEHVAWTGAGIAYALSAGGIMTGTAVAAGSTGAIDFVQISDSHIGFHQAANPDVSSTLKDAVAAITALADQPR